ncbi:MAG: polyphenol oxidase family protein [Pseudobdellovibrio sp.]
MNRFQNNCGFGFQDSRFMVFFGDRRGELLQLQNEFPQLEFLRVKQTHSDIIVKAGAEPVEADAHFTSEINKSLLIATADCMPIMIYCEQTHRAAAVHAGWRGVVNKITEKTLLKLIETGSTHKKFQIFIGPSILQSSFEVDGDVFLKLSNSGYGLRDYFSEKTEKYYVDLNKIVLSQIHNVTGNNANFLLTKIDTKIDLNFHSYRRGKHTSERNLSFICLLK